MDNFFIELPQGWENQSIYMFKGPTIGSTEHYLRLLIDRRIGVQTLTAYARERIDLILNNLQGVEVLKEEVRELGEGHQVYEFVYKWIPTENMVKFCKYYYLVEGINGYTFNIEFTKKTMKLLTGEIEKIIASFLPEGKPAD